MANATGWIFREWEVFLVDSPVFLWCLLHFYNVADLVEPLLNCVKHVGK